MRGSSFRSRHFRIETLAPGVYAAIATYGGFGLCNSGIVDLGGTSVVFDSMLTPMAAKDLLRAAERLTGRRPDVVVDSHWHGDHIRGNATFLPVRIVSTARTRALISARGSKQLAEERRLFPKELARGTALGAPILPSDRAMFDGWFRGVVATPRSFQLAPPNVTFERELTLHGDRRSLSIRTYGGGHSPSDVFAFLPDERTVFLGDLVNTQMHPSLGDGYPNRWVEILRRIRALEPRTVLPGHGEVGGTGEIRAVERYIRDLQGIVRRRRSQRRPEAFREIPIPPRYAGWKFAAFFRWNLQRVSSMLARGE